MLISAGNSSAGQAFSAKYCDFDLITRDTEKDAREAHDMIIERADWGAANNMISGLALDSDACTAQVGSMRESTELRSARSNIDSALLPLVREAELRVT